MRSLGDRIKAWAQTNQAYKLLDSSTKTRGSTWLSGGCGVMALALLKILPDSRLLGIADHRNTLQHVVVLYRNYLFDADGASTPSELLTRWSELELVHEPRLVKVAYIPEEFPTPSSLVKKVEKHLRWAGIAGR